MAEGWKRKGLFRGEGIPAPTGKYDVGCVDILADLEADETKGGLLMRLHYPTNASSAQFPYPAWFPNKRYIKGMLEVSKTKFSGLLSTLMNNLIDPRVPALLGAPLLPAESSESGGEGGSAATCLYPVVVFSPGYGAFRSLYSGILCDLASHGYVAVSLDHRSGSSSACLKRLPKSNGREGELEDHWLPHRQAPEGDDREEIFRKMIEQNVGDLKMTLDFLSLLNEGSQVRDLLGGKYDFSQFKGHLDISKTAVMGHSFGGAAVIKALAEDSRFKCGVALDPFMLPVTREAKSADVRQPLYLINCTHILHTKENVEVMVPLCQEPDESGITTHRMLTLKDTTHFTQTDIYFTIPKSFRGDLDNSILDDVEGHQLNLDICHAFLKRHLLQDPDFQGPVPNLDGGEGHSPHIIFGTNLNLSDDSNDEPGKESRNEAEGGPEGDSPKDDTQVPASSEAEDKEEDKKDKEPTEEGLNNVED